jgi:hypothetical protein
LVEKTVWTRILARDCGIRKIRGFGDRDSTLSGLKTGWCGITQGSSFLATLG